MIESVDDYGEKYRVVTPDELFKLSGKRFVGDDRYEIRWYGDVGALNPKNPQGFFRWDFVKIKQS